MKSSAPQRAEHPAGACSLPPNNARQQDAGGTLIFHEAHF
jgi:hypothetical protein